MRQLLLIGTVLLLWGCDLNVAYEENQAIANRTWNNQERMVFEYEVKDTVGLYNFYFNLRNAKTYPYANLYVFYHTYLPDGTYDIDTLQFILADPAGRWTGNPSGDMVNNQILFRRKVSFPQSGKYRFEIEQGMRHAELEGIADVGLRIERYED